MASFDVREAASAAGMFPTDRSEPYFTLDTNMHGSLVVKPDRLGDLVKLILTECHDDLGVLVADREALSELAAGSRMRVDWKRSHHAGTWHEPTRWITIAAWLAAQP